MNYDPQLHDKAVLVQLNCAFSWGTVTDKVITEETNTHKGAVTGAMHVRKKLLPAAAGVHVELVQSTLAKFYQYHVSKTFSTSTDGQRVMPTAFHLDYMEKFGETQAAGNAALEALKATFPAAVEQAKALLGSAFNAADYPDVEDIDRYYKFKYRFLPIPSGNAILKAMGASVACDVDAYVGEVMKTAASDAKLRLKKAVQRMQEQCRPKGKIFDSASEAIDDLVQTLPEIAGLSMDAELQKMVDIVRQELTGVTPKELRESAGIRSDTAKAAADIIKRMGGV